MKLISTSSLPVMLALALATVILPPTPVWADGNHSHGDSPGGHVHSGGAGDFSSIGQAWNDLAAALQSSEKALSVGDLKAIHETTEKMSAALNYLKAAGGISDEDKKLRAESALKQMLVLSNDLHAAADSADAAKSAQVLKKLQGAIKLLEIQYPAESLSAPAAMDHAGGHGKSAAVATTKIALTTAKPLTVGQLATATVKLTKPDGSPMLLADLKEAHTEKIHLLINDTSLSDYHHEHPKPTSTPGEYGFTFTPRKPGPYRVWADLVPMATDTQEYAIGDIAAATQGELLSNRTPSTTAEVDGLKYTVTFDQATLKAGEAALGKLTITEADGSPFNALEPVMGAYAHIVGFGEDFHSIAHVHPMGEEPTQPTDRGAGELAFHLQPAKPGLMRLYAQIHVNGSDKFAPFTIQVQPSSIP